MPRRAANCHNQLHWEITGVPIFYSIRIARVARGQESQEPGSAIVVSVGGQYLIPGLMDSHVHVTSIAGMVPEQATGKCRHSKDIATFSNRNHLVSRKGLVRLV